MEIARFESSESLFLPKKRDRSLESDTEDSDASPLYMLIPKRPQQLPHLPFNGFQFPSEFQPEIYTSSTDSEDGWRMFVPGDVQEDEFVHEKLDFIDGHHCELPEVLLREIVEIVKEEYPASYTDHGDEAAINLTCLPIHVWEKIKLLNMYM
jgi:hypothetical protein